MKPVRTSRGLLAVAACTIIAVGAAAFVIFRDGPPAAPSSTAANTTSVPSTPGEETPASPLPSDKAEAPKELLPSAGATVAPGSVVIPGAVAPATPAGAKEAAYQPGPSKYRNARDPRARNVLALVGADVDAEIYWLATINDPAIPAKERKDLIEDLNEDGISDPAHPATKDLPLIKSRIELIERLLPTAIDKVNADAFKEAHKDLVNMRERLNRQ